MTNTKMLREIIKNRGIKLKYIAECLEISTYGLQLKIENKKEFKASEINKICTILNITSLKEKEEIFFNNMLI